MIAYPIKFEPILQEKIWGGTKLKSLLNKASDKENIGESWEVSAVKNNVSIVSNGVYKGQNLQDLLEQYKSDLVGNKVFKQFGAQFPLLIKFIDAKEALSIQLHPNDELAQKRHESFGKTEMWYVMQADKNASLIVGFKTDCTQETYLKYLNENKIVNLLNSEKVTEGDVFFIPTGRIHAIGAGVLLAEIQQTSDITYRIFDWNRVDAQGNGRELHTDLALEAIDYKAQTNYKTNFHSTLNQTKPVVVCPYFTTNIIPILGTLIKDYSANDSFVIYICTKGRVNLSYGNNQLEVIEMGESILLPNILNNITLKADLTSSLLEVLI
ncbi:MAG: mannose-6-phosphate isomerase [Zetaproteobacteria bacterium]|nr:mannose-6-phosphate isomerase [Zetaproteobacteria bacterium]OIO13362.1 MAG: mannose-6-phosphate isomerase [Flavobacteriaceae bacterium CG1_02_35_72]